ILEHFQTGPGPTGYGLSPGGPARPPFVPAEKCEHCLISMYRSYPLTQEKEPAGPLPRYSRLASLFCPAPGQGPRRSAGAAERQLLARTCANLGRLAQQVGQSSEAEKAYRQALALEQKLAADYPDRSDYQSELGQIQRRLAAGSSAGSSPATRDSSSSGLS